jgi:hypothetical protein
MTPELRILKAARWSVLGLACLVAACGGGEPPAEKLDFTDVEVHAFSGVATARQVAVMDDAAWAALWRDHTDNVDPAPPRPGVDFGAQSVAAVFVGTNTGCERPVIQSVVRLGGDEIQVSYRIVAPEGATPCPAVVTTPVHMVRFANAGRLPVSFRRS